MKTRTTTHNDDENNPFIEENDEEEICDYDVDFDTHKQKPEKAEEELDFVLNSHSNGDDDKSWPLPIEKKITKRIKLQEQNRIPQVASHLSTQIFIISMHTPVSNK